MQKFVKEKCIAVKVFSSNETRKLFQEYKVQGIPQVIVMDGEKKEVVRVVGFRAAKEFLKTISDSIDGKEEQIAAEEALKKDENDAEARYKLAEALRKQEKGEDALKHYEKVIESDKENQKGLKVKALFRVGEAILDKAKRNEYMDALKKAEEKFKEVEQLDAEKKGGFADRIEFYRLVGKMSEKGDIRSNSDAAKEIASECSSFAEKFGESEFAPTTLFWAGYSYFFAKEYKKSLEKLEKLLKDYGDTSVAYQAKRFKEQVENKLKEEEKKEEEKKEEEKKEGGG